MNYLRSFGSDNHATVHPKILAALNEVNQFQVPSYGTDHWSQDVSVAFAKEFGPNAESFLVFNGTAANVLSLRALVTPYQSVFCSDISHLFNDECSAPESIASVKLIPVPSKNGKLTVDALDKLWIRRGDQHYAQTQGISLTQPTEVGTVYSMDELKEIFSWSKKRNLKIHIDGARLSNAAYSLQRSFREFTTDLGVDVISFGGTKNGLMFGEAIIINNPSLSKDFRYLRKQFLQLPSKSRYIAIQFLTYLNSNLWYEIAQHSVSLAHQLYTKTKEIPQLHFPYPVESNAVFAKIPKSWLKPLREKFFFYVWDENECLCRWMTSWDSTQEDIQQFFIELLSLK